MGMMMGVVLALAETGASAGEVTAELTDGGIRVKIDGQVFTEYVGKGAQRPYLYPLVGPSGANLTRPYPMEKGGAEDAESREAQFTADTVTAKVLLEHIRSLPGLKILSLTHPSVDAISFDIEADGTVSPPIHCLECAKVHDPRMAKQIISAVRALGETFSVPIPDDKQVEETLLFSLAETLGADGSDSGVLVVRQILDTTITIPLRARPGRAARDNVKHHVLPRKQISCLKLMDGGWRPCSLAETMAIVQEQEDGDALVPELGVECFVLPATWGTAPRVLHIDSDAGPTFS
jgi:hypothetical protein